MPLFCIHPAIGLSWCYSLLAGHLHRDTPVFGLQARGYSEPDVVPKNLDDLVTDYLVAIREVQPRGPYALLGWSFGGVVAHALAARLQQEGEQVEFLGMLDSYPLPNDSQHEPLAYDDPGLWAAIEASIGFNPIAPDSPLAVLGDRGLKALSRVFVDIVNIQASQDLSTFDGDVLFFFAADRQARNSPTDEWAPYITGSIETHKIGCSHGEMTQPVPLAEIGRIVATHLNREK